MSEVTFDDSRDKKSWVYVGRKKNGKPKFRKFTNQSEEFVRAYLDELGISYIVYPNIKMFFVYKDKNPDDRYAPRYSYYYSTGQWGNDKRNKHYHSDGIEHFIDTYYTTAEQEAAYWSKKKEGNDDEDV